MNVGKKPWEVAFSCEVAVLLDAKIEVMVLVEGQIWLNSRRWMYVHQRKTRLYQ